MTTKFILHGHFLSGPTIKVGLMLRLCGEPFAFRLVDLRAGAQKRPEYLKLNRFGVVPALVNGDLALCQSNAILEYLAETLHKFDGGNTPARARIREWLFWDFDRLSPGIFRSRALARGFFTAEKPVADLFRQNGEAALGELEKALAGTPFLTGSSPTIADIACHVVVGMAPEGGFDLTPYSNVRAWSGRMAALPGAKPPGEVLPQVDTDEVR